jgi:hypothetical protein
MEIDWKMQYEILKMVIVYSPFFSFNNRSSFFIKKALSKAPNGFIFFRTIQ